jgi:large subunit ribosomal protein L15e
MPNTSFINSCFIPLVLELWVVAYLNLTIDFSESIKQYGGKMGLYKYVKENWKNQNHDFVQTQRKRLVEWRAQHSTIRIDRPTRIDRARSLGYRAKQGVILVRQRVERGGRQRPSIRSGRRTAHSYQRKNLSKNYQQIAEERANESFANCEVLNSYFVGQDAIYEWYEVIMLDRNHPAVLADPQYKNVVASTGRAYRGLTSAARKSRGLRNKGVGAEKIRPSIRAKSGHGN